MEATTSLVFALRKNFGEEIRLVSEGGFQYVYLPKLYLPDGCNPGVVEGLLCPSARDGYASRLYFSHQVSSRSQKNWNGHIRVLERNWYSFSWQIPQTSSLIEMLLMHLGGLR